jgi:hypothetical protein
MTIGIVGGDILLIGLQWMFYIARHERIRVLFEGVQAGTGAEVNLIAAILRAGIIGWVFNHPAADCPVFKFNRLIILIAIQIYFPFGL